MKTPAERCAAFGWTLRPEGDGWELLGNGAPASFRSTETLLDWLEHQEHGRQQPAERDAEQLEMDLAA